MTKSTNAAKAQKSHNRENLVFQRNLRLSKCLRFYQCESNILNGLQAGAPEGACHDNVKSLGKKYHSTVGLSFTNIYTCSGKAYVVPKNPTNENFKNPLLIYRSSAPSE